MERAEPPASRAGEITPTALDHVALWVADRDALAAFLCGHLGMHEIERTERFTLVGADARRGKLTLFAADGPREPGVLGRVVLRAADLERALAELPSELAIERPSADLALFEGPERLRLGLVAAADGPGPDYDIDHVVLRVREPEAAFDGLAALGFDRDGDRLRLADKHVRLEPGPAANGAPLLNHIALLVDSAEALEEAARSQGVEIDEVVDAPNTLAVFLWGPERIKLEYVEHKPGFSLT